MLCYLFFFYHRAWSSPTQRITAHHLLYYFRFCRESFSWLFPSRSYHHNLQSKFAARICCDYLPQKFAAEICRWNLPQEFVVAICLGFFVYVSKSFLYMRKSRLHEYNLFLYVNKTFLLWYFLSYQCFFLFTVQKMKLSIKDFFNKCDQIPRKIRI